MHFAPDCFHCEAVGRNRQGKRSWRDFREQKIALGG
jgi:hypothetical protein